MTYNPSSRFLRSPDLRETLYYEAGGLCQSCGAILELDWHADHIVPWQLSQRTNIFEMQALCPQCNKRKGTHMANEGYDFTIDIGKLRPGQRGAFNKIVDRCWRGERYTSIVLPTRYGKTDVARVSTLQMWKEGIVSGALIVEPNTILVSQALDDNKMRACYGRYDINLPREPRTYTIESPPRLARLRTALFSSITTSMASRHLSTLEQWIDYVGREQGRGAPPVVFMDEAHTGSDENTWGKITTTLAEAGAFVVVMTATPFRSDGRPIPGFKFERNVVAVDGGGKERVVYEMEPHWITTIQEALEEDNPALCQITYQPFGIAGEYIRFDDIANIEDVVLDDLDESEIRRQYRAALREPIIVEKACRFFLTELQNRRRDPRQSTASGIIFVGNNDPEFDNWENQHAQEVRATINKLSPRLRCEIVVSSDPNAQDLLERFADGLLDVIIVKQMAALGLDIDHLKVALDLSNTRARASFLQRVMRIGTRWDHPGYPDEPVLTGTYIAPDDRITRARYKEIFEESGAAALATEVLTPADDVDMPSKASEDQGSEPRDLGWGLDGENTMFVPSDVVLTGNMIDFQGTEAPAPIIPDTDRFYEKFPQASQQIPKAALGAFLDDLKGPTADKSSPKAPITNQEIELPATANITKSLNTMRKRINAAARPLIHSRFRGRHGFPYSKEHGHLWKPVAVEFWGDHYAAIGLDRYNTELENIDDPALLDAVLESIEKEHKLRRERGAL